MKYIGPLTIAGIIVLSGGPIAAGIAALVGAGLGGAALKEILDRYTAGHHSEEFAAALQAGAATAAVLAITAGLSLQIGRNSSSQRGGEVPGRLPANMIESGPNSENDRLIRAPKLAASRGQQGVGRQRGLRIDTT